MIAMADRWLIWAAYVLALIFIVLTTLAGVAAMGLVLGAVIVFAAWQALAPSERAAEARWLRRTCSRLPFCD
jgi:hypothetical protein